MRLLLLHALYTSDYSYYLDWRDAFCAAPWATTNEVDLARPGAANAVRRQIREHDVVVLLHSLTADDLRWIRPLERELRDRGAARLGVFVGNEYNAPRTHLGMGERIAFLERVRPDVIASQLLPETAAWLYAEVPGAMTVSIPHALNPRRFRPGLPDAERRIDIGGRSASYAPLMGDLDRYRIYRRFADEPPPGFSVDVQIGRRFSAEEWANYLGLCRGTVATEAGGDFLERDDRTANAALDWLARRFPTLLLFGAEKRIRPGWWQRRATTVFQWITARLIERGHPRSEDLVARAEFAQLQARFFHTPNPLSGKAISSRHFDAVGTRTCQILFPGRYSDILEPDRHYLRLERDFSNLDEVLERFRDPAVRRDLTREAEAHVLARHTHAHRVQAMLAALDQASSPR